MRRSRPRLAPFLAACLAGLAWPVPEPAAGVAGQQAVGVRIVSPEADSYLSGPVVLQAEVVPATAEVERISLFADGRLVCTLERAPYSCAWDAGAGVREHVIRAVATVAGGRVVASVRTRGVAYAESVEVQVVQVSVLVKDREGRFVSGLGAADFRLYEDGVLQTLTHVADEDAPLEVVMALDISASMTGVIGDVKASARTFIDALRERDALTILGFNDNIFTVARRETRPEARLKALERLAPWGATSLYDVVSRGVGLLQKQPGRKGLVVFSDGDDESSRLPLDVVERELQSSDAVMYAVGLGRGARVANLRELLTRLSETSGGRAVVAQDATGLAAAFKEVVDDLAHQYVLSFAPSNTRRDGGWRKLSVEIPGRDYRIRARQGYRARQSP